MHRFMVTLLRGAVKTPLRAALGRHLLTCSSPLHPADVHTSTHAPSPHSVSRWEWDPAGPWRTQVSGAGLDLEAVQRRAVMYR